MDDITIMGKKVIEEETLLQNSHTKYKKIVIAIGNNEIAMKDAILKLDAHLVGCLKIENKQLNIELNKTQKIIEMETKKFIWKKMLTQTHDDLSILNCGSLIWIWLLSSKCSKLVEIYTNNVIGTMIILQSLYAMIFLNNSIIANLFLVLLALAFSNEKNTKGILAICIIARFIGIVYFYYYLFQINIVIGLIQMASLFCQTCCSFQIRK